MPVLEVLYSGPGPGCHAWDGDPARWILSGMTALFMVRARERKRKNSIPEAFLTPQIC